MKAIIRKKDLSFLTVFIVILIIISLSMMKNKEYKNTNAMVLFTFGLNLVICFINIIRSAKIYSFSFNFMFWLFGLFFFSLAPLVQFQTGIYQWNLIPDDSEIIRTNIYICIYILFYQFGWLISRKYSLRLNEKTKKINCQNRFISRKSLNFLLIVDVIALAIYLRTTGIANIIFLSTNNLDVGNKSLNLILKHCFHYFVGFIAALHILEAKKNRRITLHTVIAVLCFFLGCFPTGIPRNMMASLYGGMAIVFLYQNRYKRYITWGILSGLIFIFPAISFFRNISNLKDTSFTEYIITNIRNPLLNANFDAHQIFISILRWIQMDGITWGKQLLGAVFFFIPRKIWPSKALGTGQTAFIQTNQHWYTNVSAPLPSEGFANFGVLGIIIFAVIIGYAVYKLDRKYWNENDPLSAIRFLYPFSMLMFFFVNRGDLQSAGSYMFTQFIVGMTVYKLAVKKK